MKVSEVTVNDIVDYLKLDEGEYSTVEIQSYLDIAKAFIHSYTGIKDMNITGENIGTGDTLTTVFKTNNFQVIKDTLKVYVDDIEKTVDSDYTVLYPSGLITFKTAPAGVITVDYNNGIDAFEEFVILVYILCQDMHDNRTMYVEKSNINKVFQAVLDMHCINLL